MVTVENIIEGAILDWIKEDAPVSVKISLTRDITDKLVRRIVDKLEEDLDNEC